MDTESIVAEHTIAYTTSEDWGCSCGQECLYGSEGWAEWPTRHILEQTVISPFSAGELLAIEAILTVKEKVPHLMSKVRALRLANSDGLYQS